MPKITDSVAGLLNDQINRELESAYVYLAMSAWADGQNLGGAASWLRLQWEEELAHATKLIDYVGERGGTVAFRAINEPAAGYSDLLDVFRQVLAHEEAVSSAINDLYEKASAAKDYATQALLDWYVNEQVEEENAPAEIISMPEVAGTSGSGLLLVDRRLAERSRAG
ncbi:MAG TPA: ferritin [Dehalococcoidia bacterium]|nr:ferritin [Dehalococcoidia bacterium]